MDDSKAKLLFMMMPFVVLVVAGAILVLFASTPIWWEEGRGYVFYTPLGIPGVLLILIGVGALALIKLRS